jgi:hypothetical protein
MIIDDSRQAPSEKPRQSSKPANSSDLSLSANSNALDEVAGLAEAQTARCVGKDPDRHPDISPEPLHP